MSLRKAWFALLIISILSFSGCRKATPDGRGIAESQPPPQAEVIARIHWLGKQKVHTDTNYSALTAIWNLPESTNVEALVLTRVSTALSKQKPQGLNQTNLLLLPLLKELLHREVLIEARQTTNGPGALTLAVGIPPDAIASWRTNLSRALESIGFQTNSSGSNELWTITKGGKTWFVESYSSGDWTIVSSSLGWNSFASNAVSSMRLNDSRIEATNYLFQFDGAPAKFARAFGMEWGLPKNFPSLKLFVSGTSSGVRISGDAEFNSALSVPLESWNVPTNLVFEPLISFTAVRGLDMWVENQPWWTRLNAGSPPVQVFWWAQLGMPFLSYMAAPASNAPTILNALQDAFLTKANAHITNHGIGFFSFASNKLEWAEAPLMNPFVSANSFETSEQMLFGGLAPLLSTNKGIPDVLLTQLRTPTNTVYYDWEFTSARLEQWMNFSQLIRLAFGKAQLPTSSPIFVWLRAMEGRLENSGTRIQLVDANRLSFLRNSTIGLTAAELVLLADWLESPEFPQSLHSLSGKSETIYPKKRTRGTQSLDTSKESPAKTTLK